MYALPFLTVLVSLMMIKKSSQKPYCIIAGIFCTLSCSIYTGKTTLLQGITTLFQISKNVILNNTTLFVTLLLFGILIQLITDSGSIKKMTSLIREFLYNKWHFCIFLTLCAIISSVDDYLACIILITLFKTCYKSFNLTKEELCFYINTIVVACCSTLPISTWAPVINKSLKTQITLDSFSSLRYCFNYFTYFSVFAIYIAFFLKRIPLRKDHVFTKRRHAYINFETITLLVAVSILYITYITFSKCTITFLSNNPLLISCILTLLFCHIVLQKHGNIKRSEVKYIYIKGLKSMWDLIKFLCLLWIYTNCLEQILEINETIFNQVTGLAIPNDLLPFVIFIFSGFISYCTGSVFATVKLLVPISITLGTSLKLDAALLCLITSASLNGSLLASVSPLSDTIAICCKEVDLSSSKAYHSHAPFSLIIIALSAIAYLISGYTLKFNLIFSIVLPILTLCPLIIIYVECINELNLKKTFMYVIYNYHIFSNNDSLKHQWRFVKHNKKSLSAYKKHTTKAIPLHVYCHLKLC